MQARTGVAGLACGSHAWGQQARQSKPCHFLILQPSYLASAGTVAGLCSLLRQAAHVSAVLVLKLCIMEAMTLSDVQPDCAAADAEQMCSGLHFICFQKSCCWQGTHFKAEEKDVTHTC